MRKKIIVTAIILAIVAIIAAAAAITRSLVIEKAFESIDQIAARYQWKAEIDTGSILHPACIPVMTFRMPSGKSIVLHNMCFEQGLPTLIDSTPNISFTLDALTGEIEEQDIGAFRKKSAGTNVPTEGNTSDISDIKSIIAGLTIADVDITIGEKGRQLTIRTKNARLISDRGHMTALISFVPGVDIAKAPAAVENMPETGIRAEYDIVKKTGKAEIAFSPYLALGTSTAGHTVEARIGNITAEIRDAALSAEIRHISVTASDGKYPVRLDIDSTGTQFSPGIPSRETLGTVHIAHPRLFVPIEKILNAPAIQNNTLFSGLVDFWQQDAGAYLGKAPRKSVRREDVKKPRQKIEKNPISPETLQKIHDGFDRFRNKINNLPAFDIQNGCMTLSHGESNFTLDALALNTAELFKKDSHQFELSFNIRSAAVDFRVAYADDSKFPQADIKIDALSAPDFLRLVNLPIPEKSDGTVSLDLTFKMSDEALTVIGNTTFTDFAFYHEKISPNLIHDFNATARLTAGYEFASDKLSVKPIELTTGPVTATGYIDITDVRSDPLIKFELGANDISCADIPKAIPKGFFPNITALELEGTAVSPKIRGKIPWKAPLTSSLRATGFENLCIPTLVLPFHPEEVAEDDYTFTTPYTYFAEEITVGPGTDSYTTLSEIPPYVRAAMYLTEDKRFFEHGPIRVSFIERAMRLNLNQRSYVYGGSTIGQQLTKNLFLNRSKNIARKVEEIFLTWYLVTYVPKSRLFELYINIIEFGPDVYGIKNAAKFYFDKLPSELTPLEGAYLASLKIAPSNGGKFYKKGAPKPGSWWNRRLRYILKVLAENGYIAPAEAIAAYPWIPQFVYPEEDAKEDPRNIWLENYTQYQKEKSRQRREAKREREKESSK